MPRQFGALLAIAALIVTTACATSLTAQAEDPVEKAGVAVGVTAGNLVVIPAKAVSMMMGTVFGAASFVLTGGNAEVTRQIWQNSLEGPYLVTPELAKKAIGERPELMREDLPQTERR